MLKLGILNAIHPEQSSLDWGGTPVDGYIRFLRSVDAPFEFIGYAVAQGELPPSPDACDAYLISGSPKGVYDTDPWIAALADFIRAAYAANKKLVGICFGHQILAHALGGNAEKSDHGWGLGLKQFTITGSKPWMPDPPTECALYFAHQDQVTALPPGAERLGSSAFCQNALFAIDDRVLGIQGHPEFSTPMMQQILARADGHVPPEYVSEAERSLDSGLPDAQRVGQWLVNFLLLSALR